MENDFTKIEDAFKKAPAKIKEALLSTELSETLQKIMEENKISSENADKVTDETGAVLLGLSPRESISISIERNTGIAKELALNVAREIEEKIFKNVLASNTHQEPQSGEIVWEEHNPFLPMLSKTTDDRQQILDNRPSDVKEEKEKPDVTSALAAEMGNLLGREAQNMKHGAHSIEIQNVKPIIPEDKLSGVVQMPRKEVEMMRKDTQETADIRQSDKKGDPYREPVE